MTTNLWNRAAAMPRSDVRQASGTTWRRVLLVTGCAASMAVAYGASSLLPVSVPSEETLARLLRGMALLKACFVLAAAGALLWRFGRPLSMPLFAGYLTGVWLMSAAVMLIWAFAGMGLGAMAFHGGEVGLLVLAWWDHRLEGAKS